MCQPPGRSRPPGVRRATRRPPSHDGRFPPGLVRRPPVTGATPSDRTDFPEIARRARSAFHETSRRTGPIDGHGKRVIRFPITAGEDQMSTYTLYTLSLWVSLGLAGMISTGCDVEPGATPASVEAAAVAGTTLVYGINHDDFNAFNCAIPHGIHGYRVYRDAVIMTAADVNTQWPDDLASNYATLSLRLDPTALLSGSLDAAINALMDSAPDHAELTIWHEAGPGNPLHYPASVTAASLTAMHKHMQ